MLGRRLLVCAVTLVALTSTGCTGAADRGKAEGEGEGEGEGAKKATVAVDPPRVGECRVLEPADVAEPSNESQAVDCERPHSAETFLVDEFDGRTARLA